MVASNLARYFLVLVLLYPEVLMGGDAKPKDDVAEADFVEQVQPILRNCLSPGPRPGKCGARA